MAIRWDTIKVNGSDMPVYLAVPELSGPLPCVVVAQHIFGVDASVQDVVHRLHRQGYVAVAPQLFHRQPREYATMERGNLLRDLEIIADMNAALAHAKSVAKVSRAGVTGYCMGGRVALLMAAANAEFKASVVHYGGNAMIPRGENQGPTPFERIKDVSCPILGLFGAEDTNPSPADVEKISAALKAHGKWHEFHSFQDTGHGFHNFLSTERYRDRASKSAWALLVDFFDLYLKQGK